MPKSPLTPAERNVRRKVASVASCKLTSDIGENDVEETDNNTDGLMGNYNHLLKKDWGVDVINVPDNQGATDY